MNPEKMLRLLELMKMLPWEKEYDFITKEFMGLITSSARFSDMASIALLLKMMKKDEFLVEFAVDLLEQVFEEVYRQTERNDFKEAQSRVTTIKFIAEAYNHKLLHSDNLFDFMYRLINYDFQSKYVDQFFLLLDTDPIDSFRIRLVCTLLSSLGHYFWQGMRRVQMDRFLIFFQRYIYSKTYVLMDLEFMILDTLDKVRPSHAFKKFENLQSVTEACDKIVEFEQNTFKQGLVKQEGSK